MSHLWIILLHQPITLKTRNRPLSRQCFLIIRHWLTISKEYKLTLVSVLSHTISLSTDIYGNITRIDNALEGLPSKLQVCEQLLENTREQLETAKREVQRPFAQEEELKTKTAPLAELDALLNLEQKDIEIVDDEPDETVETETGRKQVYAR